MGLNEQIRLIKGDITQLQVDAIVNAANTSLLGGGGVDGAIHRTGGKTILEECMKIRARQGGCNTGDAVYTSAGNLPAKYVIHTVGPVWHGGNNRENELLASCYQKSLAIANELGVESIAFPNISTGVYRFPKKEAAEIALREIKRFLLESSSSMIVYLVCFDQESYDIYKNLLS